MATSEMKRCFVIAPFGEEGTPTSERADEVLNFIIRPSLEPLSYDAQRADEIGVPGSITTQVINRIYDGELLVADLTGLNPNVMYELAVGHMLEKRVIQIKCKDEALPFDVADQRTIEFDITIPSSVTDCISQIGHQVAAL